MIPLYSVEPTLDEIMKPWTDDLGKAFAPYPEFLAKLNQELEALQKILFEKENEIADLSSRVEASPVIPRTQKVSEPTRKLSEKKVLLVDDAEINRVLLSHYFKGYPVKLDFAVNLDMANEKCSKSQFDLIVVDFDAKAIELAAGLIPNVGSATLVALSPGAFSDAEQTGAMGAGFHHYLSRGVPKEELISILREKLWKSA